jgi:cytoskeletal protein CcmA (bactofilin family)
MALFGRDRDGRDKTYGAMPASAKMDEAAPREVVMMGERDRGTNQVAGAAGMDAFLGKGTKITGKLVFEGPGRIEGQVDGEIAAQDVLTVGEGAMVNAKIAGTTIIIEGQVTGDVTARQRLELRASGRVNGNVTAPSLVVHEGAILNGQCSMGAAETKVTREKPDAATRNLDVARDAAMQVASSLQR